MPTATVSTQTHWSWLADLAEISRLSREANHSFSLSHQDIQQRTRQVQAHEDQPGDDRPPTPGTPVERGSRGRSEEGPAASPLSSPAPSIPSHPVGGDGDELACACADEPRPSSSKKDTGAALFGEFEQLQFGLGDSERSTDSEEESQDSNAAVDEEEEELKLPALNMASLPSPAVFNYLRESESLAADYFSLPALRKRCTAVEDKSTRPQKTAAEDAYNKTCEFCGQPSSRLSFLDFTSCREEGRTEVQFCCEESKQLCVLTAACMRQMVHRIATQRPTRISIKPRTKVVKKDIKSEALEKAMALMKRKKLLEEMKRRRQRQMLGQSDNLPRATTLQFSLLTPNIFDRKWVEPPSALPVPMEQHGTRHDVMEIPKHPLLLGHLTMCKYSSDRPCITVLPDRTGQCYYPSGNVAIVMFQCLPGAEGLLGYLVYEDRRTPQLLAYVDELGRLCCYNTTGNPQLLWSPSMNASDPDGQRVHKARTRLFRPVALQLTRHISLRSQQQDIVTLSFSAHKENIKFQVHRRVSMCSSHARQRGLAEAQQHLAHSKSRIRTLLGELQFAQRAQRISRGHPHKRTKSTGALNL